MTITAAELGRLIANATDEQLSDGGRYFAETCDDLTKCGHGCTGEYQARPDGALVEALWNNRFALKHALHRVELHDALLVAKQPHDLRAVHINELEGYETTYTAECECGARFTRGSDEGAHESYAAHRENVT